jgi:hypothetical protein
MRNWSQGVTAVFAIETMAFKSERHVAGEGRTLTMAALSIGVRAPEFCNYEPLAGLDFGRIHTAVKRAG